MLNITYREYSAQSIIKKWPKSLKLSVVTRHGFQQLKNVHVACTEYSYIFLVTKLLRQAVNWQSEMFESYVLSTSMLFWHLDNSCQTATTFYVVKTTFKTMGTAMELYIAFDYIDQWFD